jgi:hypothetical protein
MQSLIFTDINNTVRVEYVTDLISSTAENFTVMAIKGVRDVDRQKVGLNFQKLSSNLTAFKAFATANYLKLVKVDYKGAGTSVTLVDATPASSGAGFPLGKDLI